LQPPMHLAPPAVQVMGAAAACGSTALSHRVASCVQVTRPAAVVLLLHHAQWLAAQGHCRCRQLSKTQWRLLTPHAPLSSLTTPDMQSKMAALHCGASSFGSVWGRCCGSTHANSVWSCGLLVLDAPHAADCMALRSASRTLSAFTTRPAFARLQGAASRAPPRPRPSRSSSVACMATAAGGPAWRWW
jgi:hypothetical protein